MHRLGLVIRRDGLGGGWRASYGLNHGALWLPDWLGHVIGRWFNKVGCLIWGHSDLLLKVWREYADLSEPRCSHCCKWLAKPDEVRGTKRVDREAAEHLILRGFKLCERMEPSPKEKED